MADGYVIHAVCCVLILFVLTETSGGLQCYQCIDSGEKDTDCRDAKLLLNVSSPDGKKEEEKRNKYYKDCENEKINYTMCMIEIHSTGGNVKSYHRDCSDGKTFSFSGSATKPSRLDNLIPNNETTCTYQLISNIHICLRLCEGDMCNGPEVPVKQETVCLNVTNEFDEIETVCGASTMDIMFGGYFRYHALIPVLAYMMIYVIFM